MAFGNQPIYMCMHCGAKLSGSAKFCNYCNTAEKRKESDKENKKIWQESGLGEYVCKMCDLGWYSIFTENYNSGLIQTK